MMESLKRFSIAIGILTIGLLVVDLVWQASPDRQDWSQLSSRAYLMSSRLGSPVVDDRPKALVSFEAVHVASGSDSELDWRRRRRRRRRKRDELAASARGPLRNNSSLQLPIIEGGASAEDGGARRRWLEPRDVAQAPDAAVPLTVTKFDVKAVAVWLAESGNVRSALKSVVPIWINPACGTKPEDAEVCDLATGTITNKLNAHNKDVTITKKLPAGDWKSLVPASLSELVKSAKAAFPLQTREIPADVAFGYVRVDFCKVNGPAPSPVTPNVRLQDNELTNPVEFAVSSCMVQSSQITFADLSRIKSNQKLVVGLAFESTGALVHLAEGGGSKGEPCDNTAKRCLRMPTFVPFVWDESKNLALGGTVWADNNGDGAINSGSEAGLGNLVVQLTAGTSGSGAIIAETRTDADGVFRFDRYQEFLFNALDAATLTGNAVFPEPSGTLPLAPGNKFTLRLPLTDQANQRLLEGLQPSRQGTTSSTRTLADGSAVIAQLTVPAEGSEKLDHNFGFVEQFIVSGVAWYDDDGDGLRGQAEDVVTDLPVVLQTLGGSQLGSTVTSALGEYSFSSIIVPMIPGTRYFVAVSVVNQPLLVRDGIPLTATDLRVGGDATVDNDATVATSGDFIRAIFTAPAHGAQLEHLDFGFSQYSCPLLNECSGNGICVADNSCQCHTGRSGDACDIVLTLAPTPVPPETRAPTPAPPTAAPGEPGSLCGDGLYVDNCGECGGANSCLEVRPNGPSGPTIFGSGRVDDPFYVYVAIGAAFCCVIVLGLFVCFVRRRRLRRRRRDEQESSDSDTDHEADDGAAAGAPAASSIPMVATAFGASMDNGQYGYQEQGYGMAGDYSMAEAGYYGVSAAGPEMAFEGEGSVDPQLVLQQRQNQLQHQQQQQQTQYSEFAANNGAYAEMAAAYGAAEGGGTVAGVGGDQTGAFVNQALQLPSVGQFGTMTAASAGYMVGYTQDQQMSAYTAGYAEQSGAGQPGYAFDNQTHSMYGEAAGQHQDQQSPYW